MSYNMFQATEFIDEDEYGIAISMTNHKLDERIFPRFVVITALLLKSFKHFQVTESKRMLDIFIQILEECQNKPFEENSKTLFQKFKEDLKNLRVEQINHRYLISQLQSEVFTFTLAFIANIIYHNHDTQQYLYGPTLISCFQELNLEIHFSSKDVKPDSNFIIIRQLDQNKYGVVF
ncbi:hypothetical protein ABPG72_006109 [Tetrahymena utriculariae]